MYRALLCALITAVVVVVVDDVVVVVVVVGVVGVVVDIFVLHTLCLLMAVNSVFLCDIFLHLFMISCIVLPILPCRVEFPLCAVIVKSVTD